MLPPNDSTSAGRFPMWPALPASEYYQPVWLPPGHRTVLPLGYLALQAFAWTWRTSLVPMEPFDCMPAVEPRKHRRTLALARPAILPSP